MADLLELGAEPRPRRHLDRRRVALVGVTIVVLGVGGGLAVSRPWESPAPGRLAATGAHCTVGYGTDLVVAAVEIVNRSSDRPAVIDGIDLGPDVTAARRVGGAIDSVTAEGCEHVLALHGDTVLPGATVWMGLTVLVRTCSAIPLPLVVGFDGGAGAGSVTVAAALPAGAAPVCTDVAPGTRPGR